MEAERCVQGESVSADLFPLLGVQPLLGRAFLPNEDNPGNHVVILSHALWQRRFGADRNVVGKNRCTLDGQQFGGNRGDAPTVYFSDCCGFGRTLGFDVELARIKDGGSPMTNSGTTTFSSASRD